MALPIPLNDDTAVGLQQITLSMQQSYARAGEVLSQNATLIAANNQFNANAMQLAFLDAKQTRDALAFQLATNANSPLANMTELLRAARDQPNVSPSIAFVPSGAVPAVKTA